MTKQRAQAGFAHSEIESCKYNYNYVRQQSETPASEFKIHNHKN